MRRFLFLWALFCVTAAQAADITIVSSTAMTSTIEALSATFEARSGDHLVISYGTTNQIKGRIEGGETFDLFILGASAVDELIKSGKAAGPRIDLARAAIGVAVRSGAKKPDISTAGAFKQTLLAAKSVAYSSTGASGLYFQKVAERLGIADEVKAKSRTITGGAVGELVAKGEADLAIQMISELLPVPGIDLVGPFPPDLQTLTILSASPSSTAKNAAGARKFLTFLTSPDAIATIRLKGMDPG